MGKAESGPKVEIFTEGDITLPYRDISSGKIAEISGKILKYLNLMDVSISVIITDNRFIQDINNRHRKKNSPTDVISFAYRDEPFPDEGRNVEELGDIFISIEKAEEQAPNFGNSLQGELKRLLAHGILHLLGYDHEKESSGADLMNSLEDEILGKI